jgi:hypothetical protein
MEVGCRPSDVSTPPALAAPKESQTPATESGRIHETAVEKTITAALFWLVGMPSLVQREGYGHGSLVSSVWIRALSKYGAEVCSGTCR